MSHIHSQQGIGLVEVLVAVLLLSVAVLGFSALQLQSIKATEESLVRTQALSVVRGLAENMRANPSKMKAYQDAINTPDESKIGICRELSEKCNSEQIATKEANIAVSKLKNYDITMSMVTCPGTGSSTPDTAVFSEIKCVIAAWGDTVPAMSDTDNACANAKGVYKSGSTCVIVEAY